jgi:PPOX class probable F420-dependent enzyme
MASISDPAVRGLIENPNHAVISTLNADGSVHSAVVWAGLEDDGVSVNSAVGRVWPANLDRDARVTVLIYDAANPYDYVEIRGRAERAADGADEHIDQLTMKYIGQPTYPFRAAGEQRIKYVIAPERVRHMKQ